MALTPVNQDPGGKGAGPSPLENAAKIMGILGTVASVGGQAFGKGNGLNGAQTDFYKTNKELMDSQKQYFNTLNSRAINAANANNAVSGLINTQGNFFLDYK